MIGIQYLSRYKKFSGNFQLSQKLQDVDSGLLKKHNDSPSHLLSIVYSEYEWLPWKFMHAPKNIWKDQKIVKQFFDWAGKQLSVKEYNDWDNISIKVFVLLIVLIFSRVSLRWDFLFNKISYHNFYLGPTQSTSGKLPNIRAFFIKDRNIYSKKCLKPYFQVTVSYLNFTRCSYFNHRSA
jgi:hypothetical protein